MQFSKFRDILRENIKQMVDGEAVLYSADVSGDELWELYLDSFPSGTNEVYKARREFDCGCCKQFVRSFGGVVAIKKTDTGYEKVSIWDVDTGSPIYQPVVDALSALVKQRRVRDVFVTRERGFGTERSHQRIGEEIVAWDHFRFDLPANFVWTASESEESRMGKLRDRKNVFARSLNEITLPALDQVIGLIAQGSLYKGDEWQSILTTFRTLHREYHALPENKQDLYAWAKSMEVGDVVAKIKNHSIGVLLVDISKDEMDLDAAVRRYEAIVAPSNYKRPKPVFSAAMLDKARKTLTELGLLDSLKRRHAALSDVTINNVLFANKDAAKKMGGAGDVFAQLKQKTNAPAKFGRVDTISIDEFVNQVLPTAESLEVLFEGRHLSNLVSLIAPVVGDSPSLFKWSNGLSWSYTGNVADSMKERVKAAGGNVDGVLRFSLQWNDGSEPNQNDYDAHCIEPKGGSHIYFGEKRSITGGTLDVDIIAPKYGVPAVENITWATTANMKEGVYKFHVHNFSHNGGRDGFSAEIEFDGQIFSFAYPHDLGYKKEVAVATVSYSKKDGFKIVESLPSSSLAKTVWGMTTGQFQPVTVAMFSPNYWDGQSGIGHKHYFFMLAGAQNDSGPNGFYNEFLREEFMEHRNVFEALGSAQAVAPVTEQLSGLGFSSTKPNAVTVKVGGAFERVLQVTF